MFKKSYAFMLIVVVGFSGCAVKKARTITVGPISGQSHQDRPKREVIKEEILIKNNPTLDTKSSSEATVSHNRGSYNSNSVVSASELNGETMERIAFPEDEYRNLKKIGNRTVSGRVYLQNVITDQKVMGNRVKLYLNPVTSYSKQWYDQSYLGGYKLSPSDKRLNNYLKLEYSNENGEFRFFGVPKGSYYLIGQMSCDQRCGFDSKKSTRLVKEIYVGSDLNDIELMKNVP